MEQSHYSEVNIYSANEEIHRIFLSPKVHYHDNMSPPLDHVLSHFLDLSPYRPSKFPSDLFPSHFLTNISYPFPLCPVCFT